MKKFLLLAILGLVLGGGVWKAQNPDATVDDLKANGLSMFERLKSGVDSGIDAVVAYPGETREAAETATAQQTAEEPAAATGAQALVDEQAVSVDTVSSAVAELDTALKDTRARADAGNVRLDAIDRRLELLVRRLDEQTTDDQIASLSEQLESLQVQLSEGSDTIAEQTNTSEEALAQVVEQTESLRLRLDTLARTASEDESTTASTDATDTGVIPDSPSLAALTTSIDERLSGIEQRVDTVNADSRKVETLTQQLLAANNRIDELTQQNSAMEQSLEELGESVDELNTLNESLSIEAIQARISDQLELAQSQFDNSTEDSDTAELEELLQVTRNRIQTLEQRVQNLPASSSEADDAQQIQNALQAQIGSLEERLENITQTDPALESRVNDVKEQVEQLSAQGFVTQEELRRQSESEAVEYKIYFNRDSADITDEAARVLDSFIAQETNRTTGVSIFGFTDRSGSATHNQQLALQRATNVRSYLIQNGLDFSKITALSGLGEDAAAAVLPDDAADAQQRVVVLYAEQP